MNESDFLNSPSGRLVPTISGRKAFVPHPLAPAELDLGRLAGRIASANLALGELSGIGRTLANPHLLIRPFLRVEAVASSRIEGTVTSMHELLALELSPDAGEARSETIEVRNYSRALEFGLKRVLQLPLSKRLMCELHRTLLDGVAPGRGAHVVPGELKREQNWIGGRTIEAARFVPPPPAETLDALDALEKFIHRQPEDLPLLVKIAMIHYQFETIHPFPDGNGRVGRLLVPILLCEWKMLSQPLLYISAFFEKHYDRYIDLMFDVSKSGAWESWIDFFLVGVETASRNAIAKAQALQELRDKYLAKIRTARTSALLAKVIDAMFEIPAITIPIAESELGVTYNSAKKHLQKLVEFGFIRPAGGDRRPQWFHAHEIMEIITAPDP